MNRSEETQEEFPILGDRIGLPLVYHCGYNAWHHAARLPWHSHSGFEVVALLEGGAAYEFSDGVTLSLSGGEYYVSLPGQEHRGAEGVNPPSKMAWIVFDPEGEGVCRNTCLLPADMAGIAAAFRARERRVLRCPPTLSLLLRLFRDATARSPGAARWSAAERFPDLEAAMLRALVCQILLEVASAPPAPPPRPTAQVDAVRQRLEDDYALDIDMDDIAADVGMSRSRLHTVFREATGHTPNDYLLRVRIHHAERLLVESGLSVTGVAFATGFNSSQHFCKVFRKYTGLQPMRYRAEHDSVAGAAAPGRGGRATLPHGRSEPADVPAQ